jgi:hypothetical protein
MVRMGWRRDRRRDNLMVTRQKPKRMRKSRWHKSGFTELRMWLLKHLSSLNEEEGGKAERIAGEGVGK